MTCDEKSLSPHFELFQSKKETLKNVNISQQKWTSILWKPTTGDFFLSLWNHQEIIWSFMIVKHEH